MQRQLDKLFMRGKKWDNTDNKVELQKQILNRRI